MSELGGQSQAVSRGVQSTWPSLHAMRKGWKQTARQIFTPVSLFTETVQRDNDPVVDEGAAEARPPRDVVDAANGLSKAGRSDTLRDVIK